MKDISTVLKKSTKRPWVPSNKHEPNIQTQTGLSSIVLFNTNDKEEAKANAELVAHCVNHIEEILEALFDSYHSLEQAAIDTKDSMQRFFYITKAKKLRKLHEKIEKIKPCK